MKKILALIMLTAVLVCCAAAAAYALTAEEQVKQMATSHDKVTAAECVIFRRACVVAIKTEKFATKSEYDEYVTQLKEQITSNCEVDCVYVSRSPKLMFKLTELNKLSAEERDKAIEEIIEKQLERGERKPMQPRLLQNNAQ